MIADSRTTDDLGRLAWRVDDARMRRVITKLAAGHAAFESEARVLGDPRTWYMALENMTAAQRQDFETPSDGLLLPEIGSRGFCRAVDALQTGTPDRYWISVQEGRYRYSVEHTVVGLAVKIVFSEYIAGQATWGID